MPEAHVLVARPFNQIGGDDLLQYKDDPEDNLHHHADDVGLHNRFVYHHRSGSYQRYDEVRDAKHLIGCRVVEDQRDSAQSDEKGTQHGSNLRDAAGAFGDQPRETRQIIFLLGYHENPKDQKFDPSDSQTINKKTVKPIIAKYLEQDPARLARSQSSSLV